MSKKYIAEADGITKKAEAMKLFDEAGKGHEEFKLKLQKEKDIELAQISIQKDIADAQAKVISEALQAAHIEIVGGETMFFEKVMGAITQGRSVDRMVGSSNVLKDIKETFFNGDPEYFRQQLKGFVSKFGMSSEDVKNLTVSALIAKMMDEADESSKGILQQLSSFFEKSDLGKKSASKLIS